MKIFHTIDENLFKEYEPSPAALNLVYDRQRQIKSEDATWDSFHPPRLTELSLKVIINEFKRTLIIEQLPCWEKVALLEGLPTDLPLDLVINIIDDGIYWKRKVQDRWKDSTNFVQDYGFNWKRMYLEKHLQEAVEAMTPEGFDLEYLDELCYLTKLYVRNLNLRELQIVKAPTVHNEEDFGVYPEPTDHIDLSAVIDRLDYLTELHIQFGLRNVGSDYKKLWFQFSVKDCKNLGEGVGRSTSIELLRIHSCNLDDERLIGLLSAMEPNRSLHTLDFSNCIISDDGVTAIAKYLTNKNIKTINLCNNRIKENGIASLAFVLTQPYCSPVENLNLKFNYFGDAGIKFLASALIRENCNIKSLNIACCFLGEESGILIAETLNRNFTIKKIDLTNNPLGQAAGRAFDAALAKNKIIQYLDLRMTGVLEEDLMSINQALHFNKIRFRKGEKGVEREKLIMEKRELDMKIKMEEWAEMQAKAESEAAVAAAINARLEAHLKSPSTAVNF